MAHHAEARYEEQEGLFLPPLRTLGFNPQLQLNDSLLAQSYIEAYDISYPEAVKRIADEVHEMKQRLSEEGAYELNDIGRIFLNGEGRYEFLPCEAGILSPELYGLSSYEMLPLNSVKQVSAAALDIHSDNIPSVEAEEATTPSNEADGKEETEIPVIALVDRENEEEKEKTISIKVSVLRNLAAACIAVIAFLLFPSQLSETPSQPNAGSSINTEMLLRVMPKSMTKQPDQLIETQPTALAGKEQPQEKQAVIAKEEVNNTEKRPVSNADESVPVPQKAYTIVLASQVTKKNAEAFVEHLKKNGHESARMIKTGKTIRVVYSSYASENEAYNALRPLRQNDSDFADGWVMKINN